jgi:hypothetical protein
MIIHKPDIREENGEICIAARVEFRNPTAAFPEELWYKFPKSYQDFVTDRADGFAASLLPLAMALGENLEVRGNTSVTLAHGLREYQFIQSTWQPKRFKPIHINFEGLQSISKNSTRGKVGCTFSGGVDSYYTVWNHLPRNELNPAYRLTHCLLINGFDRNTDLDNSGTYRKFKKVFEPVLNSLGLELVISRTNLRQFADLPLRRQSFGSVVTASALVLGNLFSCFYVASSYKFTRLGLHPDGSHLMLDHHLSTETMETVHDAGHLTRIEKVAALAQFPATYTTLCVCFQPIAFNPETGALENCCRCEKCARTMITLDLLGGLEKYKTFPKPIDFRALHRIDYRTKGTRLFIWEVVNLAKEKKNMPVVFHLCYAMARSFVIGKILLLCTFFRKHCKWCQKILGEEKVTRIYRWLFKSY